MSDYAFKFRFISDPGHGWLEVEWTALKAIGLNPADFSRYSYRKRNTFYLEEDCDAQRFITTFQNKYDHSPHIDEVHMEKCFIRDLPSIHA